ncbi:hypothetical protein C8Q79DRAFT_904780 [Trametes meyenii]|nr:hypothetical protein C8Q79DRAFT_904780 [Trametes meyenii]
MSHTFAAHAAGRRYDGAADNGHGDSPVILHVPYVERPHVSQTATVAAPNGFARGNSPPYESAAGVRYSPYPSPLSATTSRYAHPSRGMGMGSADISPTTSRPHTGRAQASGLPIGETIQLPPIRPPAGRNGVDNGSFHLPPISSMDNLREAQCGEPMAVLRRLQSTDEPPELTSGSSSGSRGRSTPESLAQRRHSLADPVYKSSEPSSISPGVGVGAQSTGGLRTPLSAVAALPSPSPYLPLPTPRHPQSHHQPRSEADHPETAFLSGSRPRGGRGGSGSARDDRPCLSTQSMPPSPSTSAYLDARGGVAYRLRPEEARHPPLPQERVFSRQERPLSPPPSATSADDSPVDSVRSSWRPW